MNRCIVCQAKKYPDDNETHTIAALAAALSRTLESIITELCEEHVCKLHHAVADDGGDDALIDAEPN